VCCQVDVSAVGRSPVQMGPTDCVIVGLKRDGPCAETRFRLSEKMTSPFESAAVSA
jgi:hypothetical protein